MFEVIREQVFGPKDGVFVRPCGFAVSSEAMNEYDTVACVRCNVMVRLGAYSTVSVAPSATVLSPYAPAVENNCSGGSSVCLSLAGPFFFFPLVFKRRNKPISGTSTAFEAMRNRLRRMSQANRWRASICIASAAAAAELTKPAARCAIRRQPDPTL